MKPEQCKFSTLSTTQKINQGKYVFFIVSDNIGHQLVALIINRFKMVNLNFEILLKKVYNFRFYHYDGKLQNICHLVQRRIYSIIFVVL